MKDLKELSIKNNQPELIFGQDLTLANQLNEDIQNLDDSINNLINDFIAIGFYLNTTHYKEVNDKTRFPKRYADLIKRK